MGVSFILYYALDWALEYILTWTLGRVNNAELASPAVRESSHFTTSSLGNPQNLILLLILMFFHFENVVYMREVAHFFKGTHTHPHSKSPSARGII